MVFYRSEELSFRVFGTVLKHNVSSATKQWHIEEFSKDEVAFKVKLLMPYIFIHDR